MKELQMALHDKKVTRWFATGIAGLSVVADSLSAIKYARVKAVQKMKTAVVTDYKVEGDFPKYGNNDDRVDEIAAELVRTFMDYIKGTTPTATVSHHFHPHHHLQRGVRKEVLAIPRTAEKWESL